tara:strand:- start:359 stop:502 length:144 start_codon:yes stop_codon:yes gene_type:complete
MRVAKDLGYTLADLTSSLTREELQLWVLYYELEAQEAAEMQSKARRR